ncbi:hypothetical protein INR49_021029, partial [Caranx melampygus]
MASVRAWLVPVVGCKVTLETRGLVSETDQRASGVEDLLHPDTSRPELVHALPDDGEDALGDGTLRVGPLHLVLQAQTRLWLKTEFRDVLVYFTSVKAPTPKCGRCIASLRHLRSSLLVYHLHVPPADAVQVQEHVQVTAELPEAVHRRAERLNVAFWEISSSDVLEQRADEEAQPAVLLCELIGFSQGGETFTYTLLSGQSLYDLIDGSCGLWLTLLACQLLGQRNRRAKVPQRQQSRFKRHHGVVADAGDDGLFQQRGDALLVGKLHHSVHALQNHSH